MYNNPCNNHKKYRYSLKGNTMRKLLYTIPLFLFAFTFTGGPPQGWYQQFMPDIGGRQITDMVFIDSLTGFAVTNNLAVADTGYILKTTNGGDNWFFSFVVNRAFTAIEFVNSNIGYACGGSGGGTTYLCKTTDSGLNWFTVNSPSAAKWDDISVLNEDTIWLVEDDNLTGGVFRTTNGGINWTQQLNLGSLNPEKIYMFNERTGFIGLDGGVRYIRKTTDGGLNWNQIVTNDYFNDIYFADSLLGWKCSVFGMKKTTDGGLNWITQTLPSGGIISVTGITRFSNINNDTIWGTGGYVIYPNNEVRGLLYRTTNGGDNWLAQVPDTSIKVFGSFVQFTDKNKGWIYDTSPTGIHTKTGGDTTFLSSINQIGTEILVEYKLNQNYPNPFNPSTTITYYLATSSNVRLTIFDITGREIALLVSQRQNPGVYQYAFNGSSLTSSIYFYRLQTEDYTDTKKMLLVK